MISPHFGKSFHYVRNMVPALWWTMLMRLRSWRRTRTAAHFNRTKDVDLIMSTSANPSHRWEALSAGDNEIVQYIKHPCRSMIFSASIPPAMLLRPWLRCTSCQAEPERIQRLDEIATFMRKEISQPGFLTLVKSRKPLSFPFTLATISYDDHLEGAFSTQASLSIRSFPRQFPEG